MRALHEPARAFALGEPPPLGLLLVLHEPTLMLALLHEPTLMLGELGTQSALHRNHLEPRRGRRPRRHARPRRRHARHPRREAGRKTPPAIVQSHKASAETNRRSPTQSK